MFAIFWKTESIESVSFKDPIQMALCLTQWNRELAFHPEDGNCAWYTLYVSEQRTPRTIIRTDRQTAKVREVDEESSSEARERRREKIRNF